MAHGIASRSEALMHRATPAEDGTAHPLRLAHCTVHTSRRRRLATMAQPFGYLESKHLPSRFCIMRSVCPSTVALSASRSVPAVPTPSLAAGAIGVLYARTPMLFVRPELPFLHKRTAFATRKFPFSRKSKQHCRFLIVGTARPPLERRPVSSRPSH
ncbi:hypothetical protein BDV95DRAFT_641769 [Massariosphaeria phaeospora]|uniref:Uncharacterized protein n=1 Tax=Massariosphaeria phaeospora TaxID=100035 RepID=A0A7C8I2C2_9PLEO|nr:hypothetical protein BDV95DRAFT_641769 [Massariosphaeria phaeospora]